MDLNTTYSVLCEKDFAEFVDALDKSGGLKQRISAYQMQVFAKYIDLYGVTLHEPDAFHDMMADITGCVSAEIAIVIQKNTPLVLDNLMEYLSSRFYINIVHGIRGGKDYVVLTNGFIPGYISTRSDEYTKWSLVREVTELSVSKYH